MKGKYKAVLALIPGLPLVLVLTITHWLPVLAGIWLPQGTRIAIEASPRWQNGAIMIPDLRYLAGECELASLRDATLSHPSRWRIHLAGLTLNPVCISNIPPDETPRGASRTLKEWQTLLPNTWLIIDKLEVTSWPQYAGSLHLSLTPERQTLRYDSALLTVAATLKGQKLNLSELKIDAFNGQPPPELTGEFTLPVIANRLPTQGHLTTRITLAQEADKLDATLYWNNEQGFLKIGKSSPAEPLLFLPWAINQGSFEINGGQWNWPYAGLPLRGGLALRFDHWRQGLENTIVSGRINVITRGKAGKANAVLSIGPGKVSMTSTALPLQLTGEAKHEALIFYAQLPGELSGAITDPRLLFRPGALLRSRGRVIDALNIDEVRWPLAGVHLSGAGVNGRLQAILRAHENSMGKVELHLDGKAMDFLPGAGLWRWRYWGKGRFTPMQAKWDVTGTGEWRDSVIELSSLSTGFDKLEYGSMLISKPRMVLDKPLHWRRDERQESFSGHFSLNAGTTTFSAGSTLPPSRLTFSVSGRNPSTFRFTGDLHARAIGPVRVNGRWDGERLRGEAWWPQQNLMVFQPLIPPGWTMLLKEGALHAQVAFSAAAGQGFAAGGHGVVKSGSVGLPDHQINDVNVILPFRFSDSGWHFGTHGPVKLRIAEVRNQITTQNISADLQGWYPWSEPRPLLLSHVSADVLGGKVVMQQLRMPQRDAALIRLQNLSLSELITAINPKQFTLSGRINGALPLWLSHPRWMIKDGWLTSPGAMTFRMDKEMADAMIKDNIAAGAAINWLRYMEINRSLAILDLDNSGLLKMRATVTGTSRVDDKSGTVNLNYSHQENLFALWRSLRFGDNLQTWLEEHATLPPVRCIKTGEACEDKS